MSKKKGWIFIINPVAGNGYAMTLQDKIKEMCDKHNIKPELVYTERKGHATELTSDYIKKGYDHIMAVGGDGTFNEVAQSLVNHKDIVFGPISAGTGNDFIQITGFSDHFTDHDWEVLFEENVIGMDVGQCNDKYFINGMGLGMDAQVASENYRHENEDVKKGGKSKYLWHIVKTILFYKEKTAKVTYDGKTNERQLFLNSFGMGRRMAGGMFLTPKAIANDGLIDICMIQKLGLFGRLKELSAVKKQTHLQDKVVEYIQTGHIVYEFDEEVPSHLDGELYYNTRFEVECLPAKINIIYNPHGNHYFKVD